MNLSSILRPTDFLRRHGFTMANLRAIIDKFKGFRVTVLGDLIVDEYIDCDPLGMSQEDPSLVVTPYRAKNLWEEPPLLPLMHEVSGRCTVFFSFG